MKRVIVVTLAVLIGCGAGAAALAQESDAAKSKPEETGGRTHKVEPERLKIEVDLSGTFTADTMVPIALHPESWSAFTVIRAVPHGKSVKKGETLVWLDTRQIDEQLADLKQTRQLGQLAQRTAEASLKAAKVSTPLDLADAERAKRIADEDLAYFLNTERPHDEQSAKFSLRSAQHSLDYAMEELKQLEKMYQADDLTEETEEIVLKRARHDVERAKFYLESSELRTRRTLNTELPRRETETKEAAARADIALIKARAALPAQLQKDEIEFEKQQVENRRNAEKLKKLEQDRRMMEVRAPADGYVYYGRCERGKWSGLDPNSSTLRRGGKLTPHSVFMTIVRPRPLHIRADVPEKELHRLRRGLQGTASPVGFPELELPASVQQISSFPVGTNVFDGRLSVELGNDARAVVPGMSCQVTLVAYDKADALTVPAKAVFEDPETGTRNTVYVQRGDGKPEPRKVSIGQKTDEKWEVLQGLAAGDEILLEKPE